ncbi:hypothetical protein ACYSNW_01425 [Enterococcus sp. LJL99]
MSKKLDELIVESQNISGSMSALSGFSYRMSFSRDEIDELNGLIAAIQCLTEKHSKNMEDFELEQMKNRGQ